MTFLETRQPRYESVKVVLSEQSVLMLHVFHWFLLFGLINICLYLDPVIIGFTHLIIVLLAADHRALILA